MTQKLSRELLGAGWTFGGGQSTPVQSQDPSLPPCPICGAPAQAGYDYTRWDNIAHNCLCCLSNESQYDHQLRTVLWPSRKQDLRKRDLLKTAKSDFLSSLPVEYRQYTWASLQVTEANRAALQSIRPNGITCYQPLGQKGSGSLYLYGTPGTGKTHLGVAIAQEICETHVCRYFSAKALKSQMQQAALGNAEWPDLVTPDLILFDDLEKINPTAYTYEWFFDALETRLNNRRGSIFTSQQRPGATALRLTPVDHEKLKAANGNPALLKEVEQERLLQAGALASRMSAGLKFEITGRDNRANH